MNIKNILAYTGFSVAALAVIITSVSIYRNPSLVNSAFSKVERADSMEAAASSGFRVQALAQAYSAYGCKDEDSSNKPIDVFMGTTTISFPVGKRQGLSSIKLTSGFPNDAKLTIPGSNLSYTSKDKGSCIDLKTFNDKGTSIVIKKTCTVIAYGGYGSTGSFGNAVEGIVNKFKKANPNVDISFITKSKDYAGDAGSEIIKDIQAAQKTNPKGKIFLTAHSISAIGAWNVKSQFSTGIEYQLYDPPYNADKILWGTVGFPSWFAKLLQKELGTAPGGAGNGQQISIARGSGIATGGNVTVWTCGYSNLTDYKNCQGRSVGINSPSYEQMVKDHEMWNLSISALDKVQSWLNTNCKVPAN